MTAELKKWNDPLHDETQALWRTLLFRLIAIIRALIFVSDLRIVVVRRASKYWFCQFFLCSG